jgi:hypothetical protein
MASSAEAAAHIDLSRVGFAELIAKGSHPNVAHTTSPR